MKKTFSVILALGLCLSLFGCAKPQENTAIPAAEITMEEYLALGLSDWFPTGKTDFRVQAKMVSEDTEVYNALEDAHYTAQPNGEDVILKGTQGEEWVTKLSKAAKTYTKPDGTEITLDDFAALDT